MGGSARYEEQLCGVESESQPSSALPRRGQENPGCSGRGDPRPLEGYCERMESESPASALDST